MLGGNRNRRYRGRGPLRRELILTTHSFSEPCLQGENCAAVFSKQLTTRSALLYWYRHTYTLMNYYIHVALTQIAPSASVEAEESLGSVTYSLPSCHLACWYQEVPTWSPLGGLVSRPRRPALLASF